MSKIKIGIHPSEWLFILELHGNVCYYCRSSNVKLTMDHYIPLSKGGEHIPENIVPACARCNGRKHATMPDVFLERMEKEYA
jgi:5-methylcytosine-specific restriction endonuclease McrA